MADMYYVAEIRTSYSNFPAGLRANYPTLHSLKNNVRPTNRAKGGNYIRGRSNVEISTLRGLPISLLAKSQEYEFDFYDYVVVPYLKVGLYTETWGNGVGGLDNPECNLDYRVQSNMVITMSTVWFDLHIKFMTFPYTKDHSKYGISSTTTKAYVCMADMNR